MSLSENRESEISCFLSPSQKIEIMSQKGFHLHIYKGESRDVRSYHNVNSSVRTCGTRYLPCTLNEINFKGILFVLYSR